MSRVTRVTTFPPGAVMKLIPCAPPRGTVNAAPLTTLITPTMQQLERWEGFWGEDDVYYARLSASDESQESPRWFRVGPEAGTPIQAMDVVPPPTTVSASATASRQARGVVLCARLRRGKRDAGASTTTAPQTWGVVMRGGRKRNES